MVVLTGQTSWAYKFAQQSAAQHTLWQGSNKFEYNITFDILVRRLYDVIWMDRDDS